MPGSVLEPGRLPKLAISSTSYRIVFRLSRTRARASSMRSRVSALLSTMWAAVQCTKRIGRPGPEYASRSDNPRYDEQTPEGLRPCSETGGKRTSCLKMLPPSQASVSLRVFRRGELTT